MKQQSIGRLNSIWYLSRFIHLLLICTNTRYICNWRRCIPTPLWIGNFRSLLTQSPGEIKRLFIDITLAFNLYYPCLCRWKSKRIQRLLECFHIHIVIHYYAMIKRYSAMAQTGGGGTTILPTVRSLRTYNTICNQAHTHESVYCDLWIQHFHQYNNICVMQFRQLVSTQFKKEWQRQQQQQMNDS